MRPPDGIVARWVHSDCEVNLTRTFVPEFLLRFKNCINFSLASQMPKQVSRAGSIKNE